MTVHCNLLAYLDVLRLSSDLQDNTEFLSSE